MMQHADIQIESKETFPKQTYRNRALVMTAGGVRPLIVPVVRTHGNHTRTEETGIDYRTRWNIVHLRTIEAAYAASPYYLYYKDGLEQALTTRHDCLLDLNRALMEWLFKCLKISVKIEYTTDWMPSHPLDFRNAFSPKTPAHGTASGAQYPPYYQVFSDRMPFVPDLSVVDLLFNLGPEAREYLSKVQAV
ncbi:MAG: WbqC family protein [Bacteroidales bacterium]|nr:WbqC family protein [Bacteroidales bacterium]